MNRDESMEGEVFPCEFLPSWSFRSGVLTGAYSVVHIRM